MHHTDHTDRVSSSIISLLEKEALTQEVNGSVFKTKNIFCKRKYFSEATLIKKRFYQTLSFESCRLFTKLRCKIIQKQIKLIRRFLVPVQNDDDDDVTAGV